MHNQHFYNLHIIIYNNTLIFIVLYIYIYKLIFIYNLLLVLYIFQYIIYIIITLYNFIIKNIL